MEGRLSRVRSDLVEVKESGHQWSSLTRHWGRKAGWTSYFSVSVINYPDKRQVREAEVCFGLQFLNRHSPPGLAVRNVREQEVWWDIKILKPTCSDVGTSFSKFPYPKGFVAFPESCANWGLSVQTHEPVRVWGGAFLIQTTALVICQSKQ